MGADNGAQHADHDLAHLRETLPYQGGQPLGSFDVVAVADEYRLAFRLIDIFAHLVDQTADRFFAALFLFAGNEMAFVVHVEHRLDMEQGANKRGSACQAAAAAQIFKLSQ